MKPNTFLWPGLLLLATNCIAQSFSSVRKFGDVPAETFAGLVYAPDTSASAVILFDKGTVNFQGALGREEGLDVVYERHCRVRILNRNAFRLGTLGLALYKKGIRTMMLDNFKGATYNLEDGKIVTTPLDKSNIFKDQSGDFEQVRIAFPNVKEGSVIEYTYRIIYPGFGTIPSWSFQGEYPVVWSEYEVTIPTLVDYVTENRGYLPFSVDSSASTYASYDITFAGNNYARPFHGVWQGNAVRRIWGIGQAPALAKKEPYTTTLSNHISKVEFQLSSFRMQGYERTYRSTWSELVDELLKKESFGVPLTDRNHWMDDTLRKITGPDKTSLQAARAIYYYVRDQFACTNAESIYLSQPLRKVWEDKKGGVGDINLLLTALYRRLGFEAAPVILSSRSHGIAFDLYPLLKDYNYVITRVKVGDRYYLLDASKDNIGFGQLPELCYNGRGRVIDPEHTLVALSPDSLMEKRTTLVMLANSDTVGYSGSFYHATGSFESMELRARLKKLKPDDFFEAVHKTMAAYKTMKEPGFDSLDNPNALLSWHYTMQYHFSKDKIYFNPIMHERTNTNPFSASERHYPVEMPFCMDYSYVLDMEVPKGYRVDEAPQPERILLDEGNSGFFEYLVSVEGVHIQFRYRLVLKKAYFPVEEYQGLRDFYGRIIKKEQEEFTFSRN